MKSQLGLDATLPVVDIVKDAVLTLWLKRQTVMSRFLPVILVLALVDWIGRTLVPEEAYAIQIGMMVFSMAVGIVFATACHRLTLNPDAGLFTGKLWSTNEWRYLGRVIRIGLMCAAAIVLISLVSGLVLTPIGVPPQVPAVIAVLVGLYIGARLSVTLPELALGQDSDIRRAWSLSDGNGSRLVIVVWLVPLALTVPFLLLMWVETPVAVFVAAVGTYIATLISLATLSLSYRFLADIHDRKSSGASSRPDSSSNGFDA